MPSIDVLIVFTAAALLMNISPGPSNLYVMARSIAQGIEGGLVAAAGLAAGGLVHVAATVLGLSAIFNASPALYTAIKVAGACYLLYLGITYWRTPVQPQQAPAEAVPRKGLRTVFGESILVEVTNPKTALFFIAFLPQFVAPESGAVWMQLMILGAIVTLSALPCDVLVAISAGSVARWLRGNPRAQIIQERVSGSILFGMGAFILVDESTEALCQAQSCTPS